MRKTRETKNCEDWLDFIGRKCITCAHDKPAREGYFSNGCPIIAYMLTCSDHKKIAPEVTINNGHFECRRYKED